MEITITSIWLEYEFWIVLWVLEFRSKIVCQGIVTLIVSEKNNEHD